MGGTLDKIKGFAKEAAGKLMGERRTEAEDETEKAEAKVKAAGKGAKGRAKGAAGRTKKG